MNNELIERIDNSLPNGTPIESTARQYYDAEENPITLLRLIKSEPEWAQSRILHLERLLVDCKAALSQEGELVASVTKEPTAIGNESIKKIRDALVEHALLASSINPFCRERTEEAIELFDAYFSLPLQPTELEMHRADYNAIKSAGFDSPGELLAAYSTLTKLVASSQDVDEFIRKKGYQDNYEKRDWCISADDLRAWMAGHARVPVEPTDKILKAISDGYPSATLSYKYMLTASQEPKQ